MPVTRIEDIDIRYDHHGAGNPAGGQRVMYVHGTGCNAKVFDEHLRAMAVRHEVAALDLPGHGESGGPGFRGAADHAFFVGALIEHLQWDNCIVAGHSLGGGIALSAALYFERLVGGLLLIDSGARLRVSPNVIEFSRRAALAGRAVGEDSRLGYAESTPQEIVDKVTALTAGCKPAVKYKDWIADDSFDVISRLPHIKVPTLAICGAEDPLTPLRYHEFLRDNLPNCTLEVIAGAGHWPFAEQAEDFNTRVLAYLDTL